MADEGDVSAMAAMLIPMLKEQLGNPENKKYLKGLQGICELQLVQKGKKAGAWHIILKGDKEIPVVVEGKAQKPTLSVTVDDDTLLKLATGKLNPITSFMNGKIKVAGNLMMAQKLESTFRSAGGYEKTRPFVMAFAESNSYLKSKL